MNSRAALAALAVLLALSAALPALAHKYNKDGGAGGGWGGGKKWPLPPGVAADQMAAVRMAFANGTVVDKPYPPTAGARAWTGGPGPDGQGKKWAHHGGAGVAGAVAGGGDHKKNKWGGAGKWGGERPALSFVLKDGTVVAKPQRPRPDFAKADVESVTAVFADGTTQVLPPPGSGARGGKPAAMAAQRPVSLVIELKNGTKITKSAPNKPGP